MNNKLNEPEDGYQANQANIARLYSNDRMLLKLIEEYKREITSLRERIEVLEGIKEDGQS